MDYSSLSHFDLSIFWGKKGSNHVPPKTQAIVTEDMKVWQMLGVWEMDSSGDHVSWSRLAFAVFTNITISSSNTLNFFMDLNDNVRTWADLFRNPKHTQTCTPLSGSWDVACWFPHEKLNFSRGEIGGWPRSKLALLIYIGPSPGNPTPSFAFPGRGSTFCFPGSTSKGVWKLSSSLWIPWPLVPR